MDGIPGRQPLGRPRARLAVPCAAGMVEGLLVSFTLSVDEEEAVVVCAAFRFLLENSDAEVGTGWSLSWSLRSASVHNDVLPGRGLCGDIFSTTSRRPRPGVVEPAASEAGW